MTTPKGGAPIKQINYVKLDKLCAIHCTGEECASILEMDYDTLNAALKRDGEGGFSDYFKKKSAVGKMSLRRKQIEVALEGSVPMLIWMGKQQLNQHDKQQTELTGAEGGSIKHSHAVEWVVQPVKPINET